jgi:pimeloyl-ACP methyl ester carboxylesterase
MRCNLGKLLNVGPLLLLLASCSTPIGASRSSVRAAYEEIESNVLRSGKPSVDTLSLLHRYDLDQVFSKDPEDAIRQLHAKAVETGNRDSLFALAEMSFLTGDQVRRSVKPWDLRDARDYYLGAAVYSYLYLFAENQLPSAFDRRFRVACDLYNYGLGLALEQPKGTNALVELRSATRRLPVGEIHIDLDTSRFPWPLDHFERFVLGDQFRVRGLSVRNRQPGIGAPLIAVESREMGGGLQRMTGATAFLRFYGGLQELSAGNPRGALELHSAFDKDSIEINHHVVPLEMDSTVHLAYGLNQSVAWKIERSHFFSLHEVVKSGVYPTQPYERGRIPVLFVHGTYSSPVRWAEMLNTLRADPELRERYQFWFFIYNSSAPLIVSAAKLRKGLTERIAEFDPGGSDDALLRMVVIGHSQGGLLTRLITTDTRDELWRSVSEKPVEEMDLSPAHKEDVRRLFFLKPMACVRRVIFIATPHRGSYRTRGLVRSLTRRLIRIPPSLAGRAKDMMSLAAQLNLPDDVDRRRITSIDGMSTTSPLLKVLAELPVAEQVKAHSIIPVRSRRLINRRSDGVVSYDSAHLEEVESELVVEHNHSCQSTPAAIEEVRRILHLHLKEHDRKFRKTLAQVE